MAKKWYPVVDILACAECGTCVSFCPHGVYDKNRFPVPVVVKPDNCIDHCHGCQKKCPSGAISYVGDTGTMGKASSCCCSSETDTVSCRKLNIEYLYLDLNTCDRCISTETVLDEVVEVLRPALELAGYTVDYRKHEMATAQIAEQYHFVSSPTILVNGQDIFESVFESDCGCCSDIAGADVDCRVFKDQGKTCTVPTKEMLASAILNHLNRPQVSSDDTYVLPENLRRFYEGKTKRCDNVTPCGDQCR
ncbi:MAG: DUF2703 domain-containing protein [Lachnospiraceae bacterium]